MIGEQSMQEDTMTTRRTILNLMGAGAAGALAFTSVASPAAAQTATSTSTATSQGVFAAAPGAKKPTSATPAMIDEAIQRSQARTAKAVPTATSAAKPEQFGSEEPFTYKPGATAN
jgi:hypothetical protein